MYVQYMYVKTSKLMNCATNMDSSLPSWFVVTSSLSTRNPCCSPNHTEPSSWLCSRCAAPFGLPKPRVPGPSTNVLYATTPPGRSSWGI